MKNEDIEIMLARIDERVKNIHSNTDQIQSHVDTIKTDLKGEIKDLSNDIRDNYTTKDEFNPIKRIVYTAAFAIIGSFIGAVSWLARK